MKLLDRNEPSRHAREPVRMRGGRLTSIQRARIVAEIFLSYLRARRALRDAPIATAVADLRTDFSSVGEDDRGDLNEARRLGWAVSRSLSFMPGDTRCLARSLVLTQLLARRGISGKLVIGARTCPEFLAHAWVEHAGDAVLSPGDGSFGRLVEL
jgi:Transglutaminase-like superfamily